MKWLVVLVLLHVTVLSAQEKAANGPSDEKKTAKADSLAIAKRPVPIFEVLDSYERRNSDSVFADFVVTRQQFVDWYHADLADLLSNLEGIYVRDLGSYGRTVTASSELGTPSSLPVLLDGGSMSDPDAGWTDLNNIPLEHIERIEYFRGAAGAQLGDAGGSGYVNIVTRKVSAATPFTRVAYRSVFSDFRDMGVIFMRPIANVGFTIGGSSKKSPGEQRRFGSFGVPFLQSRYNGKYLFSGVEYTPTSKVLVRYYGLYNRNRFDAYGPERTNGTFKTSGGERKDARWDHRLRGSWSGDRHSLDLSLTHIGLDKHFSAFATDRVPGKYTARRLQFDATYRRWMFAGFSSQIGYSRREDRAENLLSTVTYHKTDDLLVITERVADTYVSRAGVRYSKSTVYEDGLAADLMIKKTIPFSALLTLNGGYGYRYPSILDAVPATDSTQNPLSTERSLTGRLGLVFRDRLGLNNVGVSWSGAWTTDVIDYGAAGPINVPEDSLIFVASNGGSANVVSVAVHGLKDFDFLGFENSLLLQYQYRLSNAVLVRGIPRHTAYGRLTFGRRFLTNNIFVRSNLTVRYFHDHDGYTFIDAPQTYYQTGRRLSDGFLVNYRLSAEIGTIQFFIEQENILGQEFDLLDGYPVTPIRFRLGLLWRFDN